MTGTRPNRGRMARRVSLLPRAAGWVGFVLAPVLLAAAPEDSFTVDGQAFTRLRVARHDNYDYTLVPRPAPGEKRIDRIDIIFSRQEAEGTQAYGRFAWTGSGFLLKRVAGAERQTLAAGQLPLPSALVSGGSLVLRRRPRWLEILAGDRRVLRVLETRLRAGEVGLARGTGLAVAGRVRYQRVEPILFADDFMRTEEETTDFGTWERARGTWRLHSVMAGIRANPDARIRQGHEPQSERSANPFCLSGRSAGGEAVILTGYPFWSDYSAAVSVQTTGGACGILFGAKDPQNYWLVRWQLTSPGVRPGRLSLARRTEGRDEVVAETTLPGRTGNWYRLEVRSVGSLIEVWIDEARVLRVRDPRSIGGRIGLYAQGTGEASFDDVEIRSWSSLRFDHLDTLAGHGRALSGTWETLPADGTLRFRTAMTAHNRGETRLYALGAPEWGPGRFRARVSAEPGTEYGLALGLSAARTHWRFVWVPEAGGILRLLRVAAGTAGTVWEGRRPAGSPPPGELAADTGEAGVVKLFADGRLEGRCPIEGKPGGRVGLYASGPGRVTFREVEAFAAPRSDWEKPVHVERFSGDPYMQGWASPRWAWVPAGPPNGASGAAGVYAHTGDFYGPFRVSAPISHGLALFFGLDTVEPARGYALEISARGEAGRAVLRRGGMELAAGEFALRPRSVLPGARIVDERAGVLPKAPDTVSRGELTLHRDGRVIWLTANGQEVLSAREVEPLTGRALGLKRGESLDFLHVKVERAQIRDYLFERAPTDWLKVGTWEVTNRFACDPRWSHMNGRGKSAAVLWNKFEYPGDYTIEFYAGMRMRQGDMKEGAAGAFYPRVGDINTALCADGAEVFSGYNLIFAAWDPFWSEKWTRFWRRDEILEQTDREFIPRGRRRRPVKRAIEVAWDPGGRPVHGAWYFFKIRKTGNRFDAFFDNVPVFSVTDPSPLTGKRLALWTQHNSIVLARCKIGYSRLTIPEPPTTGDASEEPVPDPLPETPPGSFLSSSTHPGRAFDFETGNEGWEPLSGDTSAEPASGPGGEGRGRRSLELRNVYAGGDFGVKLPVEGMDLGRIASFEMDCALTPHTRVNLYFTLREDPVERLFVTLTGPDHNAPNMVRLGRFGPIRADGTWQHVRLDLGRALRRRFPWRRTFVVKRAVLGMLHEGYLNAGLKGNGPGDRYWIDNVMFVGTGPADARFTWRRTKGATLRYRIAHSRSLRVGQEIEWGPARTDPAFSLILPEPGRWVLHATTQQDGRWRAVPPLPFRVRLPFRVVETIPAAGGAWGGEPVEVAFAPTEGTAPDLTRTALTIGGREILLNSRTAKYDWNAHRLILDPAGTEGSFQDDEMLDFVLAVAHPPGSPSARQAADGRMPENGFRFAWRARMDFGRDRSGPPPPRLDRSHYRRLDFEDGFGGVEAYSGSSPPALSIEPRRPGSPGHALRIVNRVCGSDAGVDLALGTLSMGKNPILTFDYRSDEHARADLLLKAGRKPTIVGFTDREPASARLGDIPDVKTDGRWHTASVDFTRLMTRQDTRFGVQKYEIGRLAFGDWGYSAMPPGASYELDNIALLPVVSTVNGFRLSWSARDPSGISAYAYIWSPEAEREAPTTPLAAGGAAEFGRLSEGRQFFHLRARDGAGNWGPTSHYPFLIDNTPPDVSEVHPPPDTGAAAARIRVRFKESLAGIDPATIRLKVNGARCALSAYTAAWAPGRREFTWNQLAVRRVMREIVPHGKEMTFELSGVRDFAGNEADPFAWTWRIDYSADRVGPAPPRLWSKTYDFRNYSRFEDSTEAWRTLPGTDRVTEVKRHVDEATGDGCLSIRKIGEGRRFVAFRPLGNVRLAAYPIVSFDCRIMPGVRIDFLLRGQQDWRAVRLTGAADAPALGHAEGAEADGTWRHVTFNLGDMLTAAGITGEAAAFDRIAFGERGGRTNPVEAQFYIDNFALVEAGGPVPLVSASAVDVTGIGALEIGFDRDALGAPSRGAPPAHDRIPLGGVDAPGLWYIHARARDGAGNWGRTVHYPYYCPVPIPPSGMGDGLEAGNGWAIGRRKGRARGVLHATRTVGRDNTVLALELYASANAELALRRAGAFRLTGAATVVADLYSHAKLPFEMAAYIRLSSAEAPIVGERVTIRPREWLAGVRFAFAPGALPTPAGDDGQGAACDEMGFRITPSKKIRTTVVIDNVRLVPPPGRM